MGEKVNTRSELRFLNCATAGIDFVASVFAAHHMTLFKWRRRESARFGPLRRREPRHLRLPLDIVHGRVLIGVLYHRLLCLVQFVLAGAAFGCFDNAHCLDYRRQLEWKLLINGAHMAEGLGGIVF